MPPRRKKTDQNLTRRYLSGDFDEESAQTQQRFSERSAGAQQQKMERTALLRAAVDSATAVDLETLPIGQVRQVYSLYCDVEHEGTIHLCVVRKTLNKLAETHLVVGDRVRFRGIGAADEQGRPEAVIEQVLPRATVLTRADSFKAISPQPIVANARQMLIVVSLRQPEVKWGLVDRMLIAAASGGLAPIVCLNKIDLAQAGPPQDLELAEQVLAHYQRLGLGVLKTSAPAGIGLEDLCHSLRGQTTVLAGHSGVGKSSLINAIAPHLDLRTAAISGYTGKGRHTTTSARRFTLFDDAHVIDTPGVKLFGLWDVTRENLIHYFPDLENGSAPDWRRDSYARIRETLPEETYG
jgi:ribosome biogenesis GTPase